MTPHSHRDGLNLRVQGASRYGHTIEPRHDKGVAPDAERWSPPAGWQAAAAGAVVALVVALLLLAPTLGRAL